MSNYDVTTLETKIPSEHFTKAHALALDLVGFTSVDEGAGVYLYTPREVGTSDFDIREYEGETFDASWASMLDETGLAPYAESSFVQDLRAVTQQRYDWRGGKGTPASEVDWTQVVQAMLRDLPMDAVPHLDLQGAYWADKERQSNFGGFAVRITRDQVRFQESPQQFFERLDREQKWADKVRIKPPKDRVEDVIEAVLGESETSLGHALREAFPEATSGDVSPDADRMAVIGLTGLVNHWVDSNVLAGEDEPETPRP